MEDEEEHFSDVPLEEEKDEEPTEDGDELENVAGSDREEVTGSDRKSRQQYRGLHRNPLFCGAEHTCLWELERVRRTHHPHHIHYFLCATYSSLWLEVPQVK